MLAVGVAPAAADDFVVDSTADAIDANPGDGFCATPGGACTLRAAIQEANELVGADRVELPEGTFTLTIVGVDDTAAAGDLDVTDSLVIEGAGPGGTIVHGAGIDRVFDVGVETTIRDLTITGGDPDGLNGGAIFSAPFTGDYTLTIDHVHFTNNTATHGGAIQNETGSTLVVRRSSFSGNSATFGSALENQADSASLENVTVSGENAGSGGALRNDGSLDVEHATIVGATFTSTGSLSLRATILDAGAGGTVCNASTSASSGGDNVEHGTSCALAGSGDVSGVDPLLGTLADAGDGTLTHALLPGSPAIDTVAACPPPAEDQRGVVRPIDGDGSGGSACDAGAFEAPLPGGTTTSTSSSTTSTSFSTTSSSVTTTSSTASSTVTTLLPTTTTSTIVASTTSTSNPVSTTTSTTLPSSTTSTVSGSTTTTTTSVPTTTTSSTLPPWFELTGRKLLLTDSQKPKRRKLILVSKDRTVGVGRGNGSADDPVVTPGSTLRVRAIGGDGFDVTYPLPREQWGYVKGEGNDRGYKFRKGTPVKKVIIKTGRSVKVVAKGEMLEHTLASQPDAVLVEIRLGERRYCFEFGSDGEVKFAPNKRYRAVDALAPLDCPIAEAAAPEAGD